MSYRGGFGQEKVIEDHNPKTKRVWLPVGKEGVYTFLDDISRPEEFDTDKGKIRLNLPYMFEEHNCTIDGEWNNFFTAPQDRKDIIREETGKRPRDVAVFTVINRSSWQQKVYVDGRDTGEKITVQDVIEVLVVPTRSALFRQLGKYAENLGNLRGHTFEITRGTDDKSCNCGESLMPKGRYIEFGDTYTPRGDRNTPVSTKVLDYPACFAVKSDAYIRDRLNMVPLSGNPITEDDEIPF